MTEVRVGIERLPHGADLPLPSPASAGAAGLDLHAALPADRPLRLPPGGRALVPTGIRIALPAGFEAQIRPRSGLALHHGVTVLNSPGTIDSDYRGEVGVLLVNLGTAEVWIERGMRVAQLVVAPVARVTFAEGPLAPEETGRGAAGFGSTGLAADRERALPTAATGERDAEAP